MSMNLLAAMLGASIPYALPPQNPNVPVTMEHRIQNLYRSAAGLQSTWRCYTQGPNRMSQKARRKRARWTR